MYIKVLKKGLIFDIGFHMCEDTDYYLNQGYKVIGIDADVDLVNAAKRKYSRYVNSKMFIPLNYAITDTDNSLVEFNISKYTRWNSLKENVSNRHGKLLEKRNVISRCLPTLFKEYGVPHYCKIDIEGYDHVCLESLKRDYFLPQYISVETECIGEYEIVTDVQIQQTLKCLYDLGYKKFKLVDQNTLQILNNKRTFFYEDPFIFLENIKGLKYKINKLRKKFPLGSSGPFGEELNGRWMNFNCALDTLMKHRRDFYRMQGVNNYGFWCDWHATT